MKTSKSLKHKGVSHNYVSVGGEYIIIISYGSLNYMISGHNLSRVIVANSHKVQRAFNAFNYYT